MKKITQIVFLLVLLLSTFSMKAQTEVMSGYWADVDFKDTTLVSSKAFSDKMVSYFYSFTDILVYMTLYFKEGFFVGFNAISNGLRLGNKHCQWIDILSIDVITKLHA